MRAGSRREECCRATSFPVVTPHAPGVRPRGLGHHQRRLDSMPNHPPPLNPRRIANDSCSKQIIERESGRSATPRVRSVEAVVDPGRRLDLADPYLGAPAARPLALLVPGLARVVGLLSTSAASS